MREGVLALPRDFSSVNSVTPLQAAALSIPIALPPVFGYETNPAFLLAPFIAWAVLVRRDAVTWAFLVAGLSGLASILIAAALYPDGRLFKDILSLVLIMFAAGFFFLGREAADLRNFVRWAAIFSAVFVIPVAIRILILQQPARISIAGYQSYNAVWLGLPTFASFGVNAAVHLTCVQTALFIGVIFGARNRWLMALSMAGLACASFLIVGSESRSSLVALCAIVALAALGFALFHRDLWRRSLFTAAALVVGIALGFVYSPDGDRSLRLLEDSGAVVGSLVQKPNDAATSSSAPSPSLSSRLDAMSSGRLHIIQLAAKEFISSPIIGTGFSPFGRYKPVPDGERVTSTSHVYYLTVLWKGGLLFALPFFSFLALAAWRMLRGRSWRSSPEAAMSAVAVAVIFGPVAFTYDTPNVPAVGALAFFLMGALGRSHQESDPKAVRT